MAFVRSRRQRVAAISLIVSACVAVLVVGCEQSDPSISAPTRRALVTSGTPTVLFEESFEDNRFTSRGWYDHTNLTTTTAQHLPGSTRALEFHFLPGTTAPTPGGATRRLFTPTPTLYVSYWVKYSDNWVGSGKPYHPHEFSILSDLDGDWDAPADNWLNVHIEHNYQNGGIPHINVQDNKAINAGASVFRTGSGTVSGTDPVANTEQRSIGGCNGGVPTGLFWECFSFSTASGYYNDWQLSAPAAAFRPAPGAGYKGNWNHVEVYLAINSIVGGVARADGVAQYWFNGTLLIDRHDVLFRTGARPAINFHQILLMPYIGDGSPVDQYMWVDNLTVATGVPTNGLPAPVASVTVAPAAASLNVGDTTRLAATLADSTGSLLAGRAVTWTSGTPAVATVDNGGLVKAIAPGTATITATSEGTSGTASVTVAAPSGLPAMVSNLKLTGVTSTSATLAFTEVDDGTGHPASYDVRLAAGSIVWEAASRVTQGTCSVPVAGVTIGATRTCAVSGLRAGSAYQFQLEAFRGTLGTDAVFGPPSNVVSATTTAANARPVVSVIVRPTSATVSVGQTVLLTATPRDSRRRALAGRLVTWATSNAAVAIVNDTGRVTGIAVGAATITATSEGKTGAATVNVTQPLVPVASVTVSPPTANVATGSTVQLTATDRDAGGNVLTGRAVTWSSSNTSLATVNGSGLVTGVAVGSVTITATSEARTGSAAVTATVIPVASVSVSPASASVTTGQTVQLTATPRDAGGTPLAGRVISWTSTNTGVATVNGSGLVTGLAVGLATITATSDGKSGTAAFTVAAPAPPPPPPAADTAWRNEPAGYTTLTNLDFSVAIPTGGDHPYTDGWGINQSNLVTRQTDATAPFLPQFVAQYSYPVGFTGSGTSPGNMYRPVPYGGYFVGFWWKYSNPWQFHSSGTNKIAFINAPVPSNLILFMDNSRHIVFQDIGDRNYLPNVNTTTLTPNVWHKIELLMEQSGRRVRVWVDGTLNVDASNVTNFPSQFTYFELDPTWGGVGGTNKTEQDYFWYGHLHISHK